MTNEPIRQEEPSKGCTPTSTKTTQNHYDNDKLLCIFELRGRCIFGDKFRVHDIDRPAILKVLAYFLQEPQMATQENIDLMKGVLITGPIGCGKTAVMRIVRSLCADSNKPVIVSCRSIAEGFMVHGHDILRKYSSNAFYAYTSVPRVHCFDDLGLENVGAFYGNACNVMAEILLSRYDLFISHKMITHVTTNLNSQEIEQSYGNRLRSRMREMFNLIAFPQESPDKRK